MGEQLALFCAPSAAGAPFPSCTHGADACCTRCTSTTDGLGFPHASEARGRRRLQACPVCKSWVALDNWIHDIPGARFGCRACATNAQPGNAVANLTLNAAEREQVIELIGGKPRKSRRRHASGEQYSAAETGKGPGE